MRIGTIRSTGIACALAVALASSVSFPIRAIAQLSGATSEATRYSAPQDSEKRVVNELWLVPVLAVTAGMALFVPAALTLVVTNPDAPATTMHDYVSVYMTAGGADYQEPERSGLMDSQNIEVFWKGLYGEGRVENYDLPEHVRLQSARVGYLLRPANGMAGGMTVGYRRARKGWFGEGVEIGFPVLMGGARFWGRFDAMYLFSDIADNWHWRFQWGSP